MERNKSSIPAAFIIAAVSASGILAASCISCGPINDLRDFADSDLFPPVIENILPTGEHSIMIEFNEPVSFKDPPALSPSLGTITAVSDDNSMLLKCSGSQQAGVKYVLEAVVCDSTGNSMSFLVPFYGFNAELPDLLINEFTTQGSTTHPDMVELLISGEGNTAGLYIVEGTTDYPEEGIILPSCTVKTGDYILIHFKPQGIPEEIDEDGEELDASGGYDVSPAARDFWVPGGTGLSGNNGVIAVYSAPGGRLLDAVLYSNRTSSSDENYAGFGSLRMLDKTVQLKEEEGWIGTGEQGALRPEDAINPDDSTATRSICRGSAPADTDTSADWHIVPTSSSTFGEINTDAVYE